MSPDPSVLHLTDSSCCGFSVLFLSHDHLGSVRAITNPAGARGEATVYKPYGERGTTVVSLQPESKGWLGERFDPETGLLRRGQRSTGPFPVPGSTSTPAIVAPTGHVPPTRLAGSLRSKIRGQMRAR
jgi:hypothetical protein